MSNVYSKLQSCRVELQKMNLSKSGKNSFSKYDYFELGDFLPKVNELFETHKLFSQFNMDKEKATLSITDTENESNVVFSIPFEDLEDEIVYEIDLLKGLWGKGMEEPKVAITNIEFSSNDIQVLGKTNNTLKIVVDGVEFIKFRIDSSDKLIQQTSDWEDDSIKNFTLDVVGRCSSNVWDNKKSPQIIIEDYNITKIN